MIAVSMVPERYQVMSLVYHFLSVWPFHRAAVQRVLIDVTHVNTLADQYQTSHWHNAMENLMLRKWVCFVDGAETVSRKDPLLAWLFPLSFLQLMAKSWDERHLLRNSGSFQESGHQVRTFQSPFLFGQGFDLPEPHGWFLFTKLLSRDSYYKLVQQNVKL